MMIWKIQIKLRRPQRFIENLKLYISHCDHINWSVEERQKVKSEGLKRQKKKTDSFIKTSSALY